VVRTADDSYVVADIPGLVEGAGRGKGLGHRFLKHIGRAAILVFMVDLTAVDRDPLQDVNVLRAEIAAFDDTLAVRPNLVVANKMDADPGVLERLQELEPDLMAISAVTGAGIEQLLERLEGEVRRIREQQPAPESYVRMVEVARPIVVTREGTAWRVHGEGAERAVLRADLDNEDSVERLQRQLLSLGVERELGRAGALEGDEVRIGDISFDFIPEPASGER
jgi:GTP-binding protein